MKRYASIDIGSQTIRLLIADCDAETLYPVERNREIVQLGSNMQSNARLQPDKIELSLACIKRFCERARAMKADSIMAVATACVRQAKNKQDFITRVQQTCGILPEIIDGKHEAHLSRAGVLAALPALDSTQVIVDIGGGSTELSFLASGYFKQSCCLKCGVIEPTEQFLHTNPPGSLEIEAVKAWIHAGFSSGRMQNPFSKLDALPVIIATAGTATTLAAMDLKLCNYEPARINGHQLSCTTINALLQNMLKLPLKMRSELAGLERGRAEVIIPGALILQHVLHSFGCTSCTICDSGLLEGIIIQHASLKKIIEKA